ncbi:zinc-binding oxidoreductase [Biscogniauxia mediterranea]|nr:zinc-binding oxidoreductase [Biscogniauxia mediterranea]
MTSTMKAWQWTKIHEKLENSLTLNSDVPVPDKSSLSTDELLIEVITAAINPIDYKLPESGWLGSLSIRGRPATPGLDFCGRVVAKHKSVTSLSEGDLVFGAFGKSSQIGSLAQFIVVSASECARLPEGVTPDQGAAVGCAATTAFQAVVVSQRLEPGSRVFVNGGSGGVGTYAVQFATALSAEVTASCSTANVELCRALGAREVIDYKAQDVVAALKEKGQIYDLVVDNVGDPGLYAQCAAFLKKNGAYMQVGISSLSMSNLLSAYKNMIIAGSRSYRFLSMRSETAWFTQIGKWMAEGKVRPVIDEAFEFDDVVEAYKKLRTGHAKGKIIVHVGK